MGSVVVDSLVWCALRTWVCGPSESSYRVLVLEVGVHIVDLGSQKVARAWGGVGGVDWMA